MGLLGRQLNLERDSEDSSLVNGPSLETSVSTLENVTKLIEIQKFTSFR